MLWHQADKTSKASSFKSNDPMLESTSVNLLHLPTELLLEILSPDNYGLSSQDIYNVAFVSRRLRDFALPLFLEAEGVKDPEQETSLYILRWSRRDFVSTRQSDALAALNLTSYVTRIKQFRCFFQDPDPKGHRNTHQSMHQLPDAVVRVSQFIEKLQQIETAEIYLVWDQYYVVRTHDITDVSLSDFKRWAKAFGTMLNLLLKRSCTSLTIQYDPSFFPAIRFRPAGSVRKAVSYLGLREEQSVHLRWEFLKPSREEKASYSEIDQAAAIPPSVQEKQSITSLSIHSPALLLPPFINWTLSLLSTHPNLTSISFACIPFQKELWAIVLPAIAEVASTQITQLRFFQNCPHLETYDLLWFISQFPNLTHLSIDRTFRTRFQNFKPSRNLFSTHSTSLSYRLPRYLKMVTLKAPVEFVSLLLGPRSSLIHAISPLPLPNLEALTVYPSSLLIHPPSYIKSVLDVNELLEAVKMRPLSNSLQLSLDVQMEFTDFRSVAHYIQNINTSSEFQRTLWETLTAEEIQKLTEKGTIPHIAFNHLTHLILYRFHPQNPDQTPLFLCLWLKTLFPNVERLTFTCRLDAHPNQDAQMGDKTIRWLTRELQEVCPTVRTLVVGEKSYDLSRET